MQRDIDERNDTLKKAEDDVVVGDKEKVNGNNTLPDFYKRKDCVDPGCADW